jgi:hypothetical protein
LGKLREASGELEQALADYRRSLAVSRFQPDVLARVAILQATLGGPVAGVPSQETRLVGQPPRTGRY